MGLGCDETFFPGSFLPLGGLWGALGGLLAGFWGFLGGLLASPRGGPSKGEHPKWG